MTRDDEYDDGDSGDSCPRCGAISWAFVAATGDKVECIQCLYQTTVAAVNA